MDIFASLITPPKPPKIGRLAVSHSTSVELRPSRRQITKRELQARIRAKKDLEQRKASVIARVDKLAERLPEGAHLFAALAKELKAL